MRKTFLRSLVVAPCVSFAVASEAAPQQTSSANPTTLPVPLVRALLDARGVPAQALPEFFVGTLPDWYPKALVPPAPAHVVGAMMVGNEVVAVFATGDTTRRLVVDIERLFTQSGFSRRKPDAVGGFMQPQSEYSSFCSDSSTVSAQQVGGRERDLVRVTVRHDMGYTCRPFPPRRETLDVLTFPELKPPSGVVVVGSHGGSGSDEVESSAHMIGPNIVPSSVLAHYAAQLVAAGWKASASAVTERGAAQMFEARSAGGAPWDGLLTVMSGGNAVVLSLTMRERMPR